MTVGPGHKILSIPIYQTSPQMITLTLWIFSWIKLTHTNMEIQAIPTSIVLAIVQRTRKLTGNVGQLVTDALGMQYRLVLMTSVFLTKNQTKDRMMSSIFSHLMTIQVSLATQTCHTSTAHVTAERTKRKTASAGLLVIDASATQS